MKNRKIVLVAFLLVAMMLLGVGYAALTDVLDITGSADINQSAAEAEFDLDVHFTAAVANDAGNTASVNSDNNDKASFSTKNLASKDDTATFTFTLTNESDLDAVVTPSISSNTKTEYFGLSSDWAGQPQTLAAGETKTYTVTVTLLATPTETISGSFIIELTAVADTATQP